MNDDYVGFKLFRDPGPGTQVTKKKRDQRYYHRFAWDSIGINCFSSSCFFPFLFVCSFRFV